MEISAAQYGGFSAQGTVNTMQVEALGSVSTGSCVMASWDLHLQNAGSKFDSVLLWFSEESSEKWP